MREKVGGIREGYLKRILGEEKAGTVPPDENDIRVNFPGIQSSNRGNRGIGHWVSFGKNKAVPGFLTRVELTDACSSCLLFVVLFLTFLFDILTAAI